jgi:hypothetical protein
VPRLRAENARNRPATIERESGSEVTGTANLNEMVIEYEITKERIVQSHLNGDTTITMRQVIVLIPENVNVSVIETGTGTGIETGTETETETGIGTGTEIETGKRMFWRILRRSIGLRDITESRKRTIGNGIAKAHVLTMVEEGGTKLHYQQENEKRERGVILLIEKKCEKGGNPGAMRELRRWVGITLSLTMGSD